MQLTQINNQLTIKLFDSRDELFQSVALDIESHLRHSLTQYGTASFIIPGGTTPGPAFQSLSNADLDWGNVTIAQSDERWLDSSHQQSNQKLTEKTLLINHASNANYVAMKNNSASAKNGLNQCNHDYQAMLAPFSVTMLGMGLDGHFASLFPGSDHIKEGLDSENLNLCIDIDASGCSVAGDYTERMSLTLSGILNSQTIILLITGQEKLRLIQSKLKAETDLNFPISYLLNQTTSPVSVYWAD